MLVAITLAVAIAVFVWKQYWAPAAFLGAGVLISGAAPP